jgi:hypothetical protein
MPGGAIRNRSTCSCRMKNFQKEGSRDPGSGTREPQYRLAAHAAGPAAPIDAARLNALQGNDSSAGAEPDRPLRQRATVAPAPATTMGRTALRPRRRRSSASTYPARGPDDPRRKEHVGDDNLVTHDRARGRA